MKASIYTRNNGKGFRIIYANGRVEYDHITTKGDWHYSCLSRSNYKDAIKAMRKYDRINGYKKAKFVCFISSGVICL